jgi:hypothetical protein
MGFFELGADGGDLLIEVVFVAEVDVVGLQEGVALGLEGFEASAQRPKAAFTFLGSMDGVHGSA